MIWRRRSSASARCSHACSPTEVRAPIRSLQAAKSLHRTQEQIDERLYAVTERGILVRSVENGLVDFPSVRDGRVVFLCWLAGESDITQWHEVDSGFAGRQPL